MAVADENKNPNLADNILMVPQKSLDKLQKQLKDGTEFTSDEIISLISPEGLADKDMVVPTDLRGIHDNFEEEFEDDFEVMMEKLGTKGTAEAILKAKEFWEQNKANEAPEKRAKTLTYEEFSAMSGFQEDDEDEDEDEDADDGQEGEGEEEEDAENDEEVDEPPTKKAKA
mmetsp:Transcript_54734/g.86653  ORF Transcript_54734/g.86653 Transcript_54734/m.86653 type:complete len:171 (+) Transcript_54734:80-592(+)